MKKEKERINANVVGADDPVCPNSEGNAKNTSNVRGITLIALVITIIVMLILVGVTVSVAIQGGLFSVAKKASKKTQIEIDKEQLQEPIVLAVTDNGELDYDKLDDNLPEGFVGHNGTYRSGSGNTFIVDENGGITFADGDLLLLIKYFLGEEYFSQESSEGKSFLELLEDIENLKFKDDESLIKDEENGLQFLCVGYPVEVYVSEPEKNDYYIYVKYNNKAYKVIVGDFAYGDYGSIPAKLSTKRVELIYEPKGNEGKKVKYSSENENGEEKEWTILYDNGNNVEIISPEVMGSVSIAEDDSLDNKQVLINSYNNAITKLNNYADTLIKNENKISVRSVGSNPFNPSSENSAIYSSEKLKELEDGKYNGVGKCGDTNYEQDFVRLSYYGIAAADNQLYWLASRSVEQGEDYVYFLIKQVENDGGLNTGDEFYCSIGTSNFNGRNNKKGVRPVVKVSTDSINNKIVNDE